MPALLPIAIGVTAASAGVSAYGSIKAGNAAKAAAYAEADRLEFNAQVAEQNAQDAIARGHLEESRFRGQVRGLIGAQRASFAGQGVDVGSGSAADVQADTAFLGELDAQMIRANAQREAYGYQVEAQDLRMGADVTRKGGRSAASAGKWNAATTLLGTGGSLALQAYGWQRASR